MAPARKKSILIVEDEGVVARQLQLSLTDVGFDVPATAASADEALQMAAEHHPDLVLMDIHIEGHADGKMDGIETAAVLRERFDVPVIYLTAYADGATVERAKRTEPYGYLVKPVDATKLRSLVEVALYKHEMDRRLRLSEAKFSGIVSISADAVISVDERQVITLFNEGAERIFGYSRAEVLGAPLEILLPERFRAGHARLVRGFAEGAVSARPMGQRDRPIFGRRKNGEEFPADAAISKIEVGDTRLLTVTLRDITRQRRVEEEHRFLSQVGAVVASTLDYRETVASIARLVTSAMADWCIIDLVGEDGVVRREAIVCADPEKAPVREFLERVPLDRHRPHLIWHVLETKEPALVPHLSDEELESMAQSPEHLEALRAAGVKSLMVVPLLVRGRLLGALLCASSTPDCVYGPRDLRLAEDLAHRAALALDNAQLYRAARRATQTRDDLLGIVAHDLRNPLNTIRLAAELLDSRRGAVPESRLQRSVATIFRSSERARRLIEDLLDVASIDAGHLSIERRRLPTSELVMAAAEGQKLLLSSASLKLRLEIEDDLPDVHGDSVRLLQVFENLIGNAIKFTRTDGHVTLGAQSEDGQILFRVADTGVGIGAEHLAHVFDRFWQVEKDKRRGAGLGLAIVKGLVEAHGGRIWVESTPGRGSTFYFSIPIAPAESAEEPPVSSGDARRTVGRTGCGS